MTQLSLFPEEPPTLYPGHEWQLLGDEVQSANFKVTYHPIRDTFYRPTVAYYRTFRGAFTNIKKNLAYAEQWREIVIEKTPFNRCNS